VLLFGAVLFGFAMLENGQLDKWTEPAEPGQFVVAIRVDRGDWQMIDDAAKYVYPLLPEAEAGDGHSGHYQKWRGSGWRRIRRHIVNGMSLQELADKSGAAIEVYVASHISDGSGRVCVVDSTGNVYLPRGDEEDSIPKRNTGE